MKDFLNSSFFSKGLGMSKEDIIVAFLKCVSQEFETSPNKPEVYIPYPFCRTLYATFLEFWIAEVEDGGIQKNIAPPHESWFVRVWRERVPNLKCRAYHTFMMCDECVSLNDR